MRNSSVKRSGAARVNEASHSFTCHPHVYPQVEWTIPAFTPQPQSVTLWPVLIFCPKVGRRLSWPEWLVTNQGALTLTHPQTVTHPSTNKAWRRTTSVIETNALPPSYAATQGAKKLTTVTYQPTDHTTRSVTIGHIYVCSMAMQPDTANSKSIT